MPRSEWWVSPGGGRCRTIAMVSVSNAISVCSVSRIDQPTILRVCRSNTAAAMRSCRLPAIRWDDFGGVACQTARAMEDGQAAVGVFMDPDRDAHKVRPAGAGRDLQAASVPFDGVVVADLALLLDAQDVSGQ